MNVDTRYGYVERDFSTGEVHVYADVGCGRVDRFTFSRHYVKFGDAIINHVEREISYIISSCNRKVKNHKRELELALAVCFMVKSLGDLCRAKSVIHRIKRWLRFFY